MAQPKALARYWRSRKNGHHKVRKGYHMARSTHKKKSFTFPLLVAAGFLPVTLDVMVQGGGWQEKAKKLALDMTGWNAWAGKWTPKAMVRGALPVFLGFMAHKVANSMGLNRMLSSAGIPFIRL
jgi:hypothetical protein